MTADDQNVRPVSAAREAAYAEAISGYADLDGAGVDFTGYARAVMAVSDAELAPLVARIAELEAEVERQDKHYRDWQAALTEEYRKAAETWDRQRNRLNEEIERLRGWIDRAEAAEVALERSRRMHVEAAAEVERAVKAWQDERARAESAEAEVEREAEGHVRAMVRAKSAEAALARVEALAAAVEKNPTGWGGPAVVSFVRTLTRAVRNPDNPGPRLRATLASAGPAVTDGECGAKHPTNPSVIPCDLRLGHNGRHHSWAGCAGSHVEWPAVSDGGADLRRAMEALADLISRHGEREPEPVEFRHADTGEWFDVADEIRVVLHDPAGWDRGANSAESLASGSAGTFERLLADPHEQFDKGGEVAALWLNADGTTTPVKDIPSATAAAVSDGEGATSEAAPCRHCGAPPEADGDHSCPCPYSDEGCPTHHPQPRTSVDEALDAWESKGPTSLTVALLADALYGVKEARPASPVVAPSATDEGGA